MHRLRGRPGRDAVRGRERVWPVVRVSLAEGKIGRRLVLQHRRVRVRRIGQGQLL
jgi:hypothetical protein